MSYKSRAPRIEEGRFERRATRHVPLPGQVVKARRVLSPRDRLLAQCLQSVAVAGEDGWTPTANTDEDGRSLPGEFAGAAVGPRGVERAGKVIVVG